MNMEKHQMPFLRTLTLIALPLSLTGCMNAFVENYSGASYPKTKDVMVVQEAPEHSKLIGTSSFVTTDMIANSDAIEAAKEVGASAVKWSRTFENQTTEYSSQPIFTETNSDGETVQQISVPVPETVNWYRIDASFWRNLDLPDVPSKN
jgi:hypothetical protein